MKNNMRIHTDYIYFYKSLAWYPVKTKDEGWVWLKSIWVIEDDRPIEYLGLLSTKHYWISMEKGRREYEIMTAKSETDSL